MKDTYIIYCLDGGDGIKIPIHSIDELFACLQRIKAEALPVIDGIFSADVVIGGLGRISVGLDSKCILTYTSEDFEETLTSLGNRSRRNGVLLWRLYVHVKQICHSLRTGNGSAKGICSYRKVK